MEYNTFETVHETSGRLELDQQLLSHRVTSEQGANTLVRQELLAGGLSSACASDARQIRRIVRKAYKRPVADNGAMEHLQMETRRTFEEIAIAFESFAHTLDADAFTQARQARRSIPSQGKKIDKQHQKREKSLLKSSAALEKAKSAAQAASDHAEKCRRAAAFAAATGPQKAAESAAAAHKKAVSAFEKAERVYSEAVDHHTKVIAELQASSASAIAELSSLDERRLHTTVNSSGSVGYAIEQLGEKLVQLGRQLHTTSVQIHVPEELSMFRDSIRRPAAYYECPVYIPTSHMLGVDDTDERIADVLASRDADRCAAAVAALAEEPYVAANDHFHSDNEEIPQNYEMASAMHQNDNNNNYEAQPEPTYEPVHSEPAYEPTYEAEPTHEYNQPGAQEPATYEQPEATYEQPATFEEPNYEQPEVEQEFAPVHESANYETPADYGEARFVEYVREDEYAKNDAGLGDIYATQEAFTV